MLSCCALFSQALLKAFRRDVCVFLLYTFAGGYLSLDSITTRRLEQGCSVAFLTLLRCFRARELGAFASDLGFRRGDAGFLCQPSGHGTAGHTGPPLAHKWGHALNQVSIQECLSCCLGIRMNAPRQQLFQPEPGPIRHFFRLEKWAGALQPLLRNHPRPRQRGAKKWLVSHAGMKQLRCALVWSGMDLCVFLLGFDQTEVG